MEINLLSASSAGSLLLNISSMFSKSGGTSGNFSDMADTFLKTLSQTYTTVIRFILPFIALVIAARCIIPLISSRRGGNPWGYLIMEDGKRISLMHWENSIGRGRSCDIVLGFSFISRSHAVLTLSGGKWTITDLNSKGGVKINGEEIDGPQSLEYGDVVSLSGLKLTLAESNLPHDEDETNTRAKVRLSQGNTLFFIIIFQLLGALQMLISMGKTIEIEVPAVLGIYILAECVFFFLFTRRGKSFELEMLALFLCGMGLFVIASRSPSAMPKQLAAIFIGMAAYEGLILFIRDLDRAQKFKYIILGLAVLLLILNIVIGQTRNGAKNWISLGFITIQPMEFVKVAYVIAGAATLDRLLTTKNLTSFIVFSGACIGTLAITKDFGTAVVFFCAFVVIAFMRSGDLRTIALICAGATLAALAVISFMPYVTSRFAAWGHVWEYANSSGYQQTRTMTAAASGGLLGVGGGNGFLVNIAASDTDLVFGVLCEEWGLIIAVTVVLIILFFAFYSVFSIKNCRSSFYSISACGVGAIFLAQTALNVFGSVDFLPLTGVTMPFVSNGGSSIISCFCLLAFIKAERLTPRAYLSENEPDGA